MITTSLQTLDNITVFNAHCGEVCYRILFCESGIIASVLDHATSQKAQRIDVFFRDPETMDVINRTC